MPKNQKFKSDVAVNNHSAHVQVHRQIASSGADLLLLFLWQQTYLYALALNLNNPFYSTVNALLSVAG